MGERQQQGVVVVKRRTKSPPKPRCGALDVRHPGVTCERPHGHELPHLAQKVPPWFGDPVLGKGRIVQYVGAASATKGAAVEDWPADVLRVHPDLVVDLFVKSMAGGEVVRAVAYSVDPQVGTWHWPNL